MGLSHVSTLMPLVKSGEMDLLSKAGLVGLVVLLFFIFKVVHTLFIHPLAKVPGPKLYAISSIPYLFHLVRGSWPRTLKTLHDQYGRAVRFTPADVSFISPEAWKTIYGHRAHGAKPYMKDLRFYRQGISGISNILNADEADHRRMRRLLSHAFSEKALRSQEDVMKKYVDLLINKLRHLSQQGSTVDIVSWYNFTTFDLIGDLAFGESFGCLENGGYNPWVSMIFNSVKITIFTQAMKRIPTLKLFAPFVFPKDIKKNAKDHWTLSQKTALRRIESNDTKREDFMSYVLRHNDDKGMTVGEIVENASSLIIAGSETTATQLSGTTFHLLMNREVYNKIAQEIRNEFNSEDEITVSRVNSLSYMRAVFDEAFRMYPPIPIGLPRITPPGGDSIAGFWIPAGTCVSVPQWSAYQSESNFKMANKFIPERWLGDPQFAADARDVLNPFSTGPRNCIGRNLANAEMTTILARVLWNFDLEIMAESKSWNEQDVFTLWHKGALNVKLIPVTRSK